MRTIMIEIFAPPNCRLPLNSMFTSINLPLKRKPQMWLVIESSSKLMSPKICPFRIFKVSPNMLKVNWKGMQYSKSIDRATLALSDENSERHDNHVPKIFSGKWLGEEDTNGGQPTTDKHADTPLQYAVDRFVGHIGDGGIVRYDFHWYINTAAYATFNLSENISEHAIIFYLLQGRKNDPMQEWGAQENVKTRRYHSNWNCLNDRNFSFANSCCKEKWAQTLKVEDHYFELGQ